MSAFDFDEEINIDEITTRLAALPKAERTEAAMADDLINFAARLPKDSLAFARLKAKLQGLGVKSLDWARVVRSHRTERESTAERAFGKRDRGNRPLIVVNRLEEFEVNEAAVEALARLPNIYQRFGNLVRVVDATRLRPGELGTYTVPEIQLIAVQLLRDLFTRAVRWFEERIDRETKQPGLVPTHPPDWSVKAVHVWRNWQHIRPLYHVSEIPVIFPDGTIVSAPGYDERTGILYLPRTEFPPVPEVPTQEDVRAAAAKLLDIVSEFPFETPERRSAWLAALLTPIARWAFAGQTPMFMLDANQAGSGKGLLLKVIGWIALGHDMDFLTATNNEEEERKRITAKILGGATMVLIDNIGTTFGSATLEALLTTGTWSERLLGSNDAPRLDVWIIWYGSGNNIQYTRDDTRRRICAIRLLSDDERPEERTDFKYDLEQYTTENRGQLVATALTMLRGWIRSGKRAAELPEWGGTWGSFNGWDEVVRGAIVYAGLPDPIGAKATKDASAKAGTGLRELIEGLEEATKELGQNGEVRATQILDALTENDEWRRADKTVAIRFKNLRAAFSMLVPKLPQGHLPNQYQIGTLLGRFKGKPIYGRRIMVRELDGNNFWRVETVPRKGQEHDLDGDIKRDAIMFEGEPVPSAGNRILIRKPITAAFLRLDRAAAGRDIAPVGSGIAH